MMFVGLYQGEKAETLIDIDSQSCKVHFARRHDPGCTHNIRRCILGSAKSRSAERRRGNSGEQDRGTVKRRRIKKKGIRRHAVDRRIEAAAFSRTVNQVLTGDQIGRLVLSARKDGASGLCCSPMPSVVVFCVFLLLFATPRRVISLFRLSAVEHLVTGRPCSARTTRGRKT